jgi:RND family efflux transporter MFP subunit
VVTERNVHPGALVGPGSGSGVNVPLLKVEQVARLRLVVPVPEKYVAGMTEGATVEFSVPAFPNQTFSGTVARIAHSVDVKTRTMPVELDVTNPQGRLASGMFPEVLWPVRRSDATLFVPTSSVARTTEATFVVRIHDGKAEWVNVQTGEVDGKLIEVYGDVHPGDEVASRGTDELRPGTRVSAKPVAADAQGPPK